MLEYEVLDDAVLLLWVGPSAGHPNLPLACIKHHILIVVMVSGLYLQDFSGFMLSAKSPML